jgi:multisubunit Na+/H+ antiporter MnhE subunit
MNKVLAIVTLTTIFALTLASFDPWDLAIGAVLSVVVMLLFRTSSRSAEEALAQGRAPSIVQRAVRFFPLCAKVVWDIIRGTWQVFLFVSGIRKLEHPGIIAVPIGERTPTGVAVSSLISTLAPGSVVMEIDFNENVILIHAIDASDPDQIRAEHQEFYDRYQRYVFP